MGVARRGVRSGHFLSHGRRPRPATTMLCQMQCAGARRRPVCFASGGRVRVAWAPALASDLCRPLACVWRSLCLLCKYSRIALLALRSPT